MTRPDRDLLKSSPGSGVVTSDWSPLLGMWAEFAGAPSVCAGERWRVVAGVVGSGRWAGSPRRTPEPPGILASAGLSAADASEHGGNGTRASSPVLYCSCSPSSGIGVRAVSADPLQGDAAGVLLGRGKTAALGDSGAGEGLSVTGGNDPSPVGRPGAGDGDSPWERLLGVVAGEWEYCGAVLLCRGCAAAGYAYFFINLVDAT